MSKEKQIEACENCLHYPACLINSEYVPTPCRVYEDKAGYRKQSEPISCGHEKGGEWRLGKSGCMYFCSECNYAAHPAKLTSGAIAPDAERK